MHLLPVSGTVYILLSGNWSQPTSTYRVFLEQVIVTQLVYFYGT
jgi:hypothetical protein